MILKYKQCSKLVIKPTLNVNNVSLFTDGMLEQKTIANKSTGKLERFLNFGDKRIIQLHPME